MDVIVEKVNIQDGLYKPVLRDDQTKTDGGESPSPLPQNGMGGWSVPSNPYNPVGIAWLGRKAIDPVEEIERSVATQRNDVVRGEGLNFAGALEQEELWKDGNSLKVDGKGPEYLKRREVGVENEGQQKRWNNEEHNTEGVVLSTKSDQRESVRVFGAEVQP